MWKKWNRLSLKNQFLVLFVIIQLLVLGLIFYYFIQSHTDFYFEQLRNNLTNQIKLILANEKVNIEIRSADEIDKVVKEWGRKTGSRITIIKRDGTVLADSTYDPGKMDNHADRPEVREVMAGEKSGLSTRRSKTLKKEMFYLARPIRKNGKIIGVIRLAKSLKKINSVVKRDIKNYFLFIVVILIFTLFIVWKFSKRIINPLSKMTDMAREIARGNLRERIKLKNYKNEIGIMARMFNYMADQLEHKIEEISEEKNKIEAILSGMVDGVIATDKSRKTVLVNPAARKIFNLEGKRLRDVALIEAVRNHRIDNYLEQAIEGNIDLAEDIVLSQPEQKYLRCHFAPIPNKDGEVIGGVIVFTDITQLRRLEQVRKDFVANVSHELRTPLTSIIGYVDTLLESEIEDPSTLERFLGIIKKEADRLALLIKDLLQLSRIEDQVPDLKPAGLEEVMVKPLRILEDSAREKNIEIRRELEDDIPLVQMIPDQIEQVMINLVDNAIKYNSPGGTVIIRAYTSGDKIFVEVEDDGMGIPEKDQERIFERFYRVDKARSRELGGTGIGLSIVNNIIKAHNSNIEVESRVGKGTTFRFFLHKAE